MSIGHFIDAVALWVMLACLWGILLILRTVRFSGVRHEQGPVAIFIPLWIGANPD